jgi:hypothetical protein
MNNLYCFYRISDNFQKTLDNQGNILTKNKPEYITKINCFQNFINIFKNYKIFVFADKCSPETIESINEILNKNNVSFKLINTNFGNGASTLRKCITTILDLERDNIIKENDNIYFIEDDYVHKPNSDKLIIDGLIKFDYVTLYDHPDKYVNANTSENGVIGNPFINSNSEQTRVFLGKYCHWKLTNSTTMTFALKFKTLKEDLPNILKYISGDFPHDFQMFLDLIRNKKRLLASSIPGFSTHGETIYLSPLTNWKDFIL